MSFDNPEGDVEIDSVQGESDLVDTSQLWKERVLPEDEYKFQRTVYDFSGIGDFAGELTFLSKLELQIGLDVKAEGVQVVEKSVDSLIQRAFMGEVIPEEIAELKSDRKPKTTPLYKEIIGGLAFCSLFEKSGKEKFQDDGEGWALLYSYLKTYKSKPEISKACLDKLKLRQETLGNRVTRKRGNIEDIEFRDIPIEQLGLVHVTDFRPSVNKGKAAILPLVDSIGAPRWTVHTFVDGMVESVKSDYTVNSWERKKVAICMPFKSVLEQGSYPDNFLQADTFFSTDPGYGLSIPKNSFIVVPSEEAQEYQELLSKTGISLIQYDKSIMSLREAIKAEYDKRKLRFFENVRTLPSSSGDCLGSDWEEDNVGRILNSPHGACSHGDSWLGSFEEDLLTSKAQIEDSKEYLTKEGTITVREAESYARRLSLQFRLAPPGWGESGRSKYKHVAYWTIWDARGYASDMVKKAGKKKSGKFEIAKPLQAALIAGII